ncbi:hypothetical protein, partial [Escherichia coli]|uniref:hypothetical protein n=1 Tax=Escherichia coli TaxID=562 RepID=UPI00207B91B9
IAEVGFPYFGGDGTEHFNKVELENVLLHKLPVKRLQLADGSTALVTTVYELTLANYGLERGLNGVKRATRCDQAEATATDRSWTNPRAVLYYLYPTNKKKKGKKRWGGGGG